MNIDIITKLVTDKLPDILLSVGIFFAFWVIGTFFKTMVRKLLDEKSPHTNISRVISGIIKNIILIIGFITALGTLGINVSAIVAGLGLTGFAFGFAFAFGPISDSLIGYNGIIPGFGDIDGITSLELILLTS